MDITICLERKLLYEFFDSIEKVYWHIKDYFEDFREIYDVKNLIN